MRRVLALPLMLAARKMLGSAEEFRAERAQLEQAIAVAFMGLVATMKPPQPTVRIENQTVHGDATQAARATARTFNAYSSAKLR